jgi:hypothetical protein
LQVSSAAFGSTIVSSNVSFIMFSLCSLSINGLQGDCR